jgi:hypothetical protein
MAEAYQSIPSLCILKLLAASRGLALPKSRILFGFSVLMAAIGNYNGVSAHIQIMTDPGIGRSWFRVYDCFS